MELLRIEREDLRIRKIEATLRVTPEELMKLINHDVNALYRILVAIENAETLFGETKEAITGEESDQVLSKSMIYLNEVREQIVGLIFLSNERRN